MAASTKVRPIKESKIKLFSWWDFVSPEALDQLKQKGFELELVEYRSNEVALAKLLNPVPNYDVVIVSNWVQNVLNQNKKLDRTTLNKIGKKRNYLHFIEKFDEQYVCLPYLWATTSYAVDKRGLDLARTNLFKLAALKNAGYKIGIIDDPMEFGAMALLSNDSSCAKKLSRRNFFDGILECNFPPAKEIVKYLDPVDFRNSIQTIVGEKTALYGWHGEIGGIIEKFDFMDFIEPDHPSVVGLDSVCILHSESIKPHVVDFVEYLTGKKLTKMNAGKMQYFSAYKDLEINYNKKIKKLFENTIRRFETEKPVTLYPPSLKTQKILNDWWQKIRYEKK